MNNKWLLLLTRLPKWRLAFFLAASFLLTPPSAFLLNRIAQGLIWTSVTLSGLVTETASLIGDYKYSLLMETYGPPFYTIATIIIFIAYAAFFLKREKRLYYSRCIKKLKEEAAIVAEGKFEHKIGCDDFPDLAGLSDSINTIVQKLKQSQEEERLAEQAKRDLITNVSHDLRTPLTSIIGYLALIEHDRYKDEVELKYYTQIAYEKATDLDKLIKDLFEYTKFQNAGMKLSVEEISLPELLRQIVISFRPQVEAAKMEIAVSGDEEGKLQVLGDGSKLARVFENIISNAIKYGEIYSKIGIHMYRDLDEAVVEIANAGEPVPESDLPYIFDRFYRVEKSRTDSQGSSGLGLAIAKAVVELHEGKISAANQGGKIIFTVRLPIGKNKSL